MIVKDSTGSSTLQIYLPEMDKRASTLKARSVTSLVGITRLEKLILKEAALGNFGGRSAAGLISTTLLPSMVGVSASPAVS